MSRGVMALLGLLLVLVLVPVVVYGIGFFVPVGHTAAGTVTLPADRATVWDLISDLEASAAWREGVYSVRPIAGRPEGAPPAYEEENDFGLVRYEVVTLEPPRLMVTRIIDNDQFGGTWTYQLEEADAATRVTITEDGEVYSPIFRFMAHFVFGYESTLNGYLASLEKAVPQGE